MIGVIGNGFVGKATQLFGESLIYDIIPEKCVPAGITLYEIVNSCKFIFICLPTPTTLAGKCHLNDIKEIVAKMQIYIKNIVNKPYIILRSTVSPKTCANLEIHHMPEFLTEKEWEKDFRETSSWIVGINEHMNDYEFKIDVKNLLQTAKNAERIKSSDVHFCSTTESEMIKYTRNVFLATKVSFFNEIEEYCRLNDINYATVRELVIKDERIGKSHTMVPGSDGNRGFGGTCLPKDTSALCQEMVLSGMKPFILRSVLERNNNHDRYERDWENKLGRSII